MTSELAKANRRAREKIKKARRRARLKAAKFVALKTASKTSPEYRRRFPPLPPMTKNEMRDLITAAVRNTQAMESRA